MNDQAFIIEHITGKIVDTLQQLEGIADKKKLKIFTGTCNNVSKDKSAGEGIYITFLGLEQAHINNQFERIQKKQKDKSGKEIEFLVQPALMFKCEYMIKPEFSSYSDIARFLGLIIRLFKDKNELDVGDCDWAGNNAYPALITLRPEMDLTAQMNIFSQINVAYSPALFYEVIVGIDSSFKEVFTRVEERKFDLYDMQEKGKK